MSEPHAPYDPTPLHKSKRELMEAVSRAIANFEKETGQVVDGIDLTDKGVEARVRPANDFDRLMGYPDRLEG